MPEWNDEGIILSAKKYGEKGLVVNILTENNGKITYLLPFCRV